MFCMGNKDKKTPKDIFPELFNIDDDDTPPPEITEEDIADMQEMMQDYKW